MGLKICGADGSIKWGYHSAASIRPWTVTKEDGESYVLTGTVVQSDAFRVTQRPLTFEAPGKNESCRWPVLTLEIRGTLLHATLGQRDTS